MFLWNFLYAVGKHILVMKISILLSIEINPLWVFALKNTKYFWKAFFTKPFKFRKPWFVFQSFIKFIFTFQVQDSYVSFKYILIFHLISKNQLIRVICIGSTKSLKCSLSDQNWCNFTIWQSTFYPMPILKLYCYVSYKSPLSAV